ncbi:uncharacterized protein LOC26515529 isoform X2 [Drosophila ananassae]|uniref:uncharacterized protein LOC26515529 isoform X2 n=1 Tax=Drosophila ananassae TaxID=7217 RepID=UPI001D000B1B|nr:uncharacterized protein LOC26515529 isoform X2 [Drosophila ananassae]
MWTGRGTGCRQPKGNEKVKMSRVRIPLPLSEGCFLRNVHTLKFNTMLVMSNGDIYCYGAFQTLHAVRWLYGVRCLALTDLGFSVIREKDHQLFLQTYLDLPGLEKLESTLQNSFDITYDKKNMFESGLRYEEYSLTSVQISENEKRFMNSLFGIKSATQCHIFSIAGHVFSLFFNSDEAPSNEVSYHVELFCVYSVSVRFIRILPHRNLCLIFLINGTVDMWYISTLLDVKQRQMYHTGSKWLDYDGTSKNGSFYYTNGEKVVRLKFEFNSQLDKCTIKTSSKIAPGIQVCTWLDHSKQLVSLSHNNIFYHIDFSSEAECETVKLSHINDFTLDSIQYVRRNIWTFDRLNRQLEFIQENINTEYEKQHIISVCKYSERLQKMYNISVEFKFQKPIWDEKLWMNPVPDKDLHNNYVYAVIHVLVNKSQSRLQYKYWQLWTFYENEALINILPSKVLLDNRYKIVIPIRKSKNEPTPSFHIQVLTFIDIKNETAALAVPILMKIGQIMDKSLINENGTNSIYTPEHYPQNKQKGVSMIHHKIRLPFKLTLSSLFNVNTKRNGNPFDLIFMDSSLRFKIFQSENMHGTLESIDASSIYYFKQYLLQNTSNLDHKALLKDRLANLQIKKFLCESKLFDIYSLEGESTLKMALEDKYNAVRNSIF